MRPPRMRFTIRRLMVAVALIAVILAGAIELPWILKRRSELVGAARSFRWRESNLRRSAARIESCPEGPGLDLRRVTSCGSCSGARMGLKPEFAVSHAEAARSLRQAADILGPWARRFERAASTPWRPLPPANPAETAAVKALLDGDGAPLRKYFEVL